MRGIWFTVNWNSHSLYSISNRIPSTIEHIANSGEEVAYYMILIQLMVLDRVRLMVLVVMML